MSMENRYNLKSPGVKRLMREAIELANPTEEYYACPLEDNLFEWHFTVRGPPTTEFEGGYYHGRILLPSQYPMQPPNIILLTPNGRFEINKKICLSISGHHPESWQPSWSIRTALLALIAFMPTAAAGTIGSLDYTHEERTVLARKSKNWECSVCGKIAEKLLKSGAESSKAALTPEESTLLEQIALKVSNEAEVVGTESTETENEAVLRRRFSAQSPIPPAIPSTSTENTDVLLEASVQSTNKDRMWTSAIWIILTIITLLVIRRIFFL